MLSELRGLRWKLFMSWRGPEVDRKKKIHIYISAFCTFWGWKCPRCEKRDWRFTEMWVSRQPRPFVCQLAPSLVLFPPDEVSLVLPKSVPFYIKKTHTHTDVHESAAGEPIGAERSSGLWCLKRFFAIKMSNVTSALRLRSWPRLHYAGVALQKTGHQILEVQLPLGDFSMVGGDDMRWDLLDLLIAFSAVQ